MDKTKNCGCGTLLRNNKCPHGHSFEEEKGKSNYKGLKTCGGCNSLLTYNHCPNNQCCHRRRINENENEAKLNLIETRQVENIKKDKTKKCGCGTLLQNNKCPHGHSKDLKECGCGTLLRNNKCPHGHSKDLTTCKQCNSYLVDFRCLLCIDRRINEAKFDANRGCPSTGGIRNYKVNKAFVNGKW